MAKKQKAIACVGLVLVLAVVGMMIVLDSKQETVAVKVPPGSSPVPSATPTPTRTAMASINSNPRRRDYIAWRSENMHKLPKKQERGLAPIGCSSRSLLVTGLPRSGTTIMGTVTSVLERVMMIHEPGNPSNASGHRCPGTRFVPVDFGFPFSHQFTDIVAEGERMTMRSEEYFDSMFSMCCNAAGTSQVVVKDPTIANNAPWMHERYGTKVVVMIRHPAALINSWKSLGWGKAGIDSLIKRYLNWMTGYILPGWDKYQGDDNWLFLRHEEFCLDPVGITLMVHEFMGENWFTEEDRRLIEEKVPEYTSPENKKARHGYHVVVLDAAQQIVNWKNELLPHEVEMIRRDTEPIWRLFYDDDDW
mmetsp:Transcript_1577/g.5557  ORF Transcript_1577/g.5557 Transcript_1577/m.5557 type:complete len:362 (+) Transcript_1577:175-1260(+)